MKAWTRWQDWVSLVLGVILFITPWVFGTATNGARSWDAWIIGVIGVILALLALAFLSAATIAEGALSGSRSLVVHFALGPGLCSGRSGGLGGLGYRRFVRSRERVDAAPNTQPTR